MAAAVERPEAGNMTRGDEGVQETSNIKNPLYNDPNLSSSLTSSHALDHNGAEVSILHLPVPNISTSDLGSLPGRKF
jgi:hypothetical protein